MAVLRGRGAHLANRVTKDRLSEEQIPSRVRHELADLDSSRGTVAIRWRGKPDPGVLNDLLVEPDVTSPPARLPDDRAVVGEVGRVLETVTGGEDEVGRDEHSSAGVGRRERRRRAQWNRHEHHVRHPRVHPPEVEPPLVFE